MKIEKAAADIPNANSWLSLSMDTTFSSNYELAYAKFVLFATTPTSAHAATTTAKIIPTANIINSFLYI